MLSIVVFSNSKVMYDVKAIIAIYSIYYLLWPLLTVHRLCRQCCKRGTLWMLQCMAHHFFFNYVFKKCQKLDKGDNVHNILF